MIPPTRARGAVPAIGKDRVDRNTPVGVQRVSRKGDGVCRRNAGRPQIGLDSFRCRHLRERWNIVTGGKRQPIRSEFGEHPGRPHPISPIKANRRE